MSPTFRVGAGHWSINAVGYLPESQCPQGFSSSLYAYSGVSKPWQARSTDRGLRASSRLNIFSGAGPLYGCVPEMTFG